MYKAFFIFCFFVANAVAQVNLVPNGSFEVYDTCPRYPDQVRGYVKDWYMPTQGSSDYFNSCDHTGYVSTPDNFYGYQAPFQGNAYAGFNLYLNNSDYKEYLAVKLTGALLKDTTYKMRFYMSLTESAKYAIKQIGVYFSNDSLVVNTSNALTSYTPQIQNNFFVTDTSGWTKVEMNYKAQGGEQFITIGNFNSYLLTDTLSVNSIYDGTYYFIDSVGLYGSITKNVEILPFNIPTVFTPNNDGINDVWFAASSKQLMLYIYNRWGNLITKQNADNVFWDGADCSDGIYYYIIETEDKKYKGTIQLIR